MDQHNDNDADISDDLNQFHQPDVHPALEVPSDDQIAPIDLEIQGIAARQVDDLARIVRMVSQREPSEYSAQWMRASSAEGCEADMLQMITKGLTRIKLKTYLITNPDLICWDPLAHYLDSICAVSANPGIQAVLPSMQQDLDFALTLKPKEWARPYKCKFGQVGFDIKSRALYLGYENHRQLFILFRPRGATITPYPAGISSGDTQLGKLLARTFWTLIWWILKDMAIGAECGAGWYVDVMDDEALGRHCNLK
jgi:hypothetical protein